MNDKQKQEYNILATKMDADYDYKLQLKDFFVKHGFIPDASDSFLSKDYHRENFETFRKEDFKSWRAMPAVRKRIIKAAKRAARAKGLRCASVKK